MRSFRMLLLAVLLLAAPLEAQTLKAVATINLPGPGGKRFDYLTIDYEDHYLLSAHLAAGILDVIDLRTNQLVKAIPNVPGVEGVEYVPELHKVYTSELTIVRWQEAARLSDPEANAMDELRRRLGLPPDERMRVVTKDEKTTRAAIYAALVNLRFRAGSEGTSQRACSENPSARKYD